MSGACHTGLLLVACYEYTDFMLIHQHFGHCGNVTDIHFDEDRETGEFKRSARVSFSSISGVEAAVALHGTRIEGTYARFNWEPFAWEGVCVKGDSADICKGSLRRATRAQACSCKRAPF